MANFLEPILKAPSKFRITARSVIERRSAKATGMIEWEPYITGAWKYHGFRPR